MKNNIIEWLEGSALRFPDKIALSDEENRLSYSQVRYQSKSIASAILSKTSAKQPVAVLSSRHVSTLCAYLGVLYSGGYYIPIDSSNPLPYIEKIVNSVRPSLILYDKENEKLIEKFKNTPSISIQESLEYVIHDDFINQALIEQVDIDPAYIIFTSGSTGVPKGVITSHRAIATFVNGYIKAVGVNENDCFGSQSSLDYVGVIKDFYTSLKLGATVFIIPKRCFVTTSELVRTLDANSVSVIAWTVAALTLPIENGTFDENVPIKARKICFTGSVMPSRSLKRLQMLMPGVELYNLYGPTELTSNCLFYKVTEKVEDNSVIPIGKPFEGYKVFLHSETNEENESVDRGELYVGGSALSLGYYNDSDLTNQIFIQNPNNKLYREIVYKTGDYCTRREDGNYVFNGRRDRMVKSHGYRIELDEIENVSMLMNSIKKISCLHHPEKDLLYLYFEGEADEKQLFMHLRKHLPSYKIPRKIRKLEKFPLMKNYKTDLSVLKKMMNEEI